MPGRYRYRLTDIAAHFGIETAGAHRALKDCAMNQQCYECMGKLLGSRSRMQGGAGDAVGMGNASGGGNAPGGGHAQGAAPDTVCPRCGSLLIKRKGRFGEFWGCSTFPGCRYTRNA